ncbi:MAG: efflux RND transporter periplasmic adaptor subunit [Isosphaeraceae bacterium]
MKLRGVLLGLVLVFGVLAIAFAFAVGPSRTMMTLRSVLARTEKPGSPVPPARRAEQPHSSLVPGRPDTLRLPPDVVKLLGVATAAVRVPERPRSLTLSGSLALDTNRLAHVHTRFVGEVVEQGTIPDPAQGTDGGRVATRPLRFGDSVEKGQILAVLWSSDLGEKKSEYIDTLSKLRLEKETLARLEELFKDQSVPERNVREARRHVESAQIAVARVERTLRSWRLSEEEIADIRLEAEAVSGKEPRRDPDRERSWARVELRAPLAGTILEVNLAVGDIVATDTDLFKIADMRTLRVWAYIYEEDLPILLALPRPVPWTIRLKSEPQAPPIAGRIEKIGDLIDPNQHTALVVGQVENPDGRMRAGQFITAQIELPRDPNEVEIPISALVEDGQESVSFVQPDASEPVYSMRRVTVARRSGRSAYLRIGSPAGGEKAGPEPAGMLRAGDRVVVSGAVELRAALAGLQDAKSGE